MSKLRSAVIGIRGIGRRHARMMEETGRMEVAALCDVNEALKEERLAEFPNARFYTSHQDMLAREELDLVAVVTPHSLHAPIAIDALGAGANVIVEKPMATKYQDCVAMMLAARANERLLTVYHNRRLDPWFVTARDAIQAGMLGRVHTINVNFSHAVRQGGHMTWRRFRETSGGVMFDWGSHLVDYALHFDTSDVTAVSGRTYKLPELPEERNANHAEARIYFESGAVANVVVAYLDYSPGYRFRILGSEGALEDHWGWGGEGKMKLHSRLPGGQSVTSELDYAKTDGGFFYANLASALLDGEEPLVSAAGGARVINVICTALRSAEQGGTPLPPA